MTLPYIGLTLDKVGPINGWVYGNVTGTNLATEIPPSGEILLEQYKSDMSQGINESGAPIFLYNPAGSNNAWLFGIAWGKVRITGETLWSFYPFVDMEIGPLESCSGTNCGIF